MEEALFEKLKLSFVKNNQTTYADIALAVESGDIKLAHRLAHTLKGNAGQIGMSGLQKAASDVEELLRKMLARSAGRN